MKNATDYQIVGLDPEQFAPYFQMTADQLAEKFAKIVTADDAEYPCRVSLAHAPIGARILLINFRHQPAPSPYQSSHAVFVAETSSEYVCLKNQIPEPIFSRLLSIRAFDKNHMMINAEILPGKGAEAYIHEQLKQPNCDYLHIHYARRGCFAAKVTRATGQ